MSILEEDGSWLGGLDPDTMGTGLDTNIQQRAVGWDGRRSAGQGRGGVEKGSERRAWLSSGAQCSRSQGSYCDGLGCSGEEIACSERLRV